MLKFLGCGSAFNTELGNNSAFIKEGKSLLLIDCGGTVFERLKKFDLLDGLENIYIIITHTHPDHVGSLGDTIFYCNHVLKKKANLFFPNKEHMEELFKYLGVSKEYYNFNCSDIVNIDDEYIGDISIKFITVDHTSKLPSYGFLLTVKDKIIYYSGDSKNIEDGIINRLRLGEIHQLYQDTCGLDYKGSGHVSLKKLCGLIPKALRSKVYCMHLDDKISLTDIEDNGFNAVKNI